MLVKIITESSNWTSVVHLPYSIGDIVKIESPRSCLPNSAITTFFHLDKSLSYDKIIEDESILRDYPELRNDKNEWKVVDIKKIPFVSSLAVLLVNRSKQYIVMSQPTRVTFGINRDILRLVREGKKRIKNITLKE